MKKLMMILLAAILIAGCSQKSDRYEVGMSKASAAGNSAYYDMDDMVMLQETADGNVFTTSNRFDSRTEDMPPLSGANQLLVKRAYVTIKVDNLDKAGVAVAGLMEKHNAYASSTDIYESRHSYTIRVPQTLYSDFLGDMGSLGKTIRSNESVEDVSVRYYDLEGRLATQKELLATYRSYLGRARNIEEILSVEERIAHLQSEIDGTGKQFRNLTDRIDYATIDLNIDGPTAINSYRGPGLGEQVRELFGSFGVFLSTLAAIIIGIVIYGIPIIVLLALLYWVLLGRIGLLKKFWQLLNRK